MARARRAVQRRAGFLGDRKQLDLGSLSRFGEADASLAKAQEKARAFVREAAAFFRQKGLADLAALAGCAGTESLPAAWEPDSPDLEAKARSIVPQRLFRGPLASRGFDLPPELQAELDGFHKRRGESARSLIYVQYWADGKRDLCEIADLVEGETGHRDLQTMVEYVELMSKCGMLGLSVKV